MNKDLIFSCTFTDGYSIRNMFEFLKGTNVEGNIVFSKDKITYTQDNSCHSILNCVYIKSSEVIYQFNSVYANEVIVGISLADIVRVTKGISKRDAFKMYFTRRDSRVHCVVLSGNSSHNNNISYLTPKNLSSCIYELPYGPDGNPNLSLPLTDFCRSISAFNTMKCLSVRFIGYRHGCVLDGLDASGILIKKYTFGDVPETATAIVTHTFRSSTLKPLSRVINVSPIASTLRLHFMAENPILMSLKVGVYGELLVYLRNEVDDD